MTLPQFRESMMKTASVFKILLIAYLTTVIAGCKLEVVAVQGGHVEWNGGSCPEGSNCVVEITDPAFSNSFTVTPKPGYEFVKWQKAPGFLCGDSTSPTCAFTMPADANVAAAVISVFVTGHIMPTYKDVGIDTDGDGGRNELDEDDDNDGIYDASDNCPLTGPDQDGYGCPEGTGVVLYDEDTDGDVQWHTPVDLGLLSTGTSIISTKGHFPNVNFDVFIVEVPEGQFLNALEFDLTDITAANSNTYSIGPQFSIQNEDVSIYGRIIYAVYLDQPLGIQEDTLSEILPLGPGKYKIYMNNAGGGYLPPNLITWRAKAIISVGSETNP